MIESLVFSWDKLFNISEQDDSEETIKLDVSESSLLFKDVSIKFSAKVVQYKLSMISRCSVWA